MRPYIYAERSGVHIFDLVQTQTAIRRACDFLEKSASERKSIVFVGTKKNICEIVEDEAKACGAFFVTRRWLGGALTNFETVRARLIRLKELDEMVRSGDLYRRGKKEQAALNRELHKLEKFIGGMKTMRGKPDILVVVDPKKEALAITEAQKIRVQVVAIVDSNCNPDGIEYVIPANDDSMRSVRLIVSKLADAIRSGGAGGSSGSNSDDDSSGNGPGLQPSGVPRVPVPAAGEVEGELPWPRSQEEEDQ